LNERASSVEHDGPVENGVEISEASSDSASKSVASWTSHRATASRQRQADADFNQISVPLFKSGSDLLG
jgi:hypothetical protein